MGFPRQEYWSGLPYSPPADLPNPGLNHWATWETHKMGCIEIMFSKGWYSHLLKKVQREAIGGHAGFQQYLQVRYIHSLRSSRTLIIMEANMKIFSTVCWFYYCLITQSCLTLVTPWTIDHPPDSSVHGISQVRILDWVANFLHQLLRWISLKLLLFSSARHCQEHETSHTGRKYLQNTCPIKCFSGSSDGKESAFNVGDLGSIPGSG